jgi:hypothetical protein
MRTEVIDDAYISFRYAENLARGQGLVFNVGERVEGYTNFLWVILLAIPARLGLDLVVSSKVLGGVFALATLWTLGTLHPGSGARPRARNLAAPGLLLTNTAFFLWAVHGLETAMFAFWITLGA